MDELTDTDSFDAYLARPLEYALGLKALTQGAAEARASRLNPPDPKITPFATKIVTTLDSLTIDDRLGIAAVAGVMLLLIVGWRYKRSAIH